MRRVEEREMKQVPVPPRDSSPLDTCPLFSFECYLADALTSTLTDKSAHVGTKTNGRSSSVPAARLFSLVDAKLVGTFHNKHKFALCYHKHFFNCSGVELVLWLVFFCWRFAKFELTSLSSFCSLPIEWLLNCQGNASLVNLHFCLIFGKKIFQINQRFWSSK